MSRGVRVGARQYGVSEGYMSVRGVCEEYECVRGGCGCEGVCEHEGEWVKGCKGEEAWCECEGV